MSVSYDELALRHPCFAKGKKGETGRIHLPVSPGCNIACRFCDRKLNDYEERPGVTAEILTPEEALEAVGRAVETVPNIQVVGIAGPGDTLASDNALNTFRLVKKKYPQLIACMSTNGLLLPERAAEIAEVGIDSLTVTVNAVDPEIEAQLNSGIYYHGKTYRGVEAAKILIENQLEGIRLVSGYGITVKINTVLVPDINGGHIGEIAKTVSEAGATIYNIIPLIPQHELKAYPPPTCAQIDGARTEAEKYISVFRHCQHCRADAVGVPGEKDWGDMIFLKRISGRDTFSHG